MAGSLLDLAKWCDTFPTEVKTAASDAAVFVSMVLVKDLAETTPVDTSAALSNWIVTLNTPSGNVGMPHVPGHHGSTASASAITTVALAEYDLASKKPGQIIYIVNNIEYMGLLNDGWSRQQPAGFFERSVVLGRAALSRYTFQIG